MKYEFTHSLNETPSEVPLELQSHTTDIVMVEAYSETNEWPATVNCEINISIWEMELQNWNLLEKHGHLLQGFKTGFHQGIPAHSIRD